MAFANEPPGTHTQQSAAERARSPRSASAGEAITTFAVQRSGRSTAARARIAQTCAPGLGCRCRRDAAATRHPADTEDYKGKNAPIGDGEADDPGVRYRVNPSAKGAWPRSFRSDRAGRAQRLPLRGGAAVGRSGSDCRIWPEPAVSCGGSWTNRGECRLRDRLRRPRVRARRIGSVA
jgi:hypothetical protein